jgi:hypothetical protein
VPRWSVRWPAGDVGGTRCRSGSIKGKGASRQLRNGHAATMCSAVAYSRRERQQESGKFPRLVHDAGDARQPAFWEEREEEGEAELSSGSRRLAGPGSEAYDRGVRAGLWLGSADCCPTSKGRKLEAGKKKGYYHHVCTRMGGAGKEADNLTG